MKQQRRIPIQKFIALFLLSAIVFFITPKELIHELYHHEESIDVICTDNCGDHLSNEHQHCEVLQFTTPPLYFHVSNSSFLSADLFCKLSAEVILSYQFASSPFLFFRGPPSFA